MNLPKAEDIWQAMDHTWPAAEIIDVAPWRLRRELGGGQRVSAATRTGPVGASEIDAAEAAMRALGQDLIFQILPDDADLDATLDARGYVIKDPVALYVGPVAAFAATGPSPREVFHTWPPLAIQREVWAEGGIGPGRIAVMERSGGAKTTFLARHKDQPAGVGYAAICGEIAMIHALDVRDEHRRAGVGTKIMCACGHWAQQNGAQFLSLAVTKENFAARGLYDKYGMSVVSAYHYRRK